MSVEENIEIVRNQLKQAALESGRTLDDVRLIAVSKTKPTAMIQQALQQNQFAFAENKVQEALEKIEFLKESTEIEWHLIGHLQKNKVKFCPGRFQWIHTLDSIELVQKLEARCVASENKIQVLIQVNNSQENSKSGLCSLDEVKPVVESLAVCEWLELRGLMTIPEPNLGEQGTRKIFAEVREWRDLLRQEFKLNKMTELSMGMTADYTFAIKEGSTMIRVGSAIFGNRNQ